MGARAMATAMVSFGLVSIPVKLFSASESSERISFNWLHKDCGSRLKQKYHCLKDDEEVSRDDMVKGYEFAKNQYVLFSPEELKQMEERSTQSIEITEFVPADQVDPVYFDKSYYLAPDKGGDRPYALFSKALQQVGRWALAKYAARGKQYLVAIRPVEGGLVMQQLHYANEVRSFADLDVPDTEVKESELKMAIQLAEMGAADSFDPEQYEDEVRKRIMTAIEQKIQGEEISIPEEEPQAQVVDLMEALKASLAKANERRTDASEASTERKPAKRVTKTSTEEKAKPAAKKSRKQA
jgi:DNA end-binding protein Ku